MTASSHSAEHEEQGGRRLWDRYTLLAALFYLAFSLFLNQAVVANFSEAAPVFPPSSLQEMHTQGWMIHALLDERAQLAHPNYFYPSAYTIVLGEPRVGVALLGLPAYLYFGGWFEAYNFAFLLAFPLCAFAAFIMCRAVTASVLASLVGGALFGFGPYMINHVGQIVLLFGMFVPLALTVAWLFGRRPTLPVALLLAALGAAQFIACAHYACFLFWGAAVLVVVSLVAHGNLRRARAYLNLALGGAAALAAVSWLLIPFWRGKQMHGLIQNTLESIEPFYSDVANLLLPSHHYGPLSQVVYRGLLALGSNMWTLFPGLVSLLLFGLWFAAVVRRSAQRSSGGHLLRLGLWAVTLLLALWALAQIPKEYADQQKQLLGSGLAVVVIALWIFVGIKLRALRLVGAFWGAATALERTLLVGTAAVYLLALGPVIHFFGSYLGYGPGAVTFALVPGFSLARVPARIIILGSTGFALFAALGFKELAARLTPAQGRIAAALVLWVVAASFPPGSLSDMQHEVKRWSHSEVQMDSRGVPKIYDWVATLEGEQPLLEVPICHLECADAVQSLYMYFSMKHWQPIVPGHTSHTPGGYHDKRRPLAEEFPSEFSLDYFEKLGIQYALFHQHFYPDKDWQEVKGRIAEFSDRLQLARQEGGVWAYRLTKAKAPVKRGRDG